MVLKEHFTTDESGAQNHYLVATYICIDQIVTMPTGRNLTDLFGKLSGEFVEPEEMNGKRRWQIIQLIPESTKANSRIRSPSRPAMSKQESPHQQQSIEMQLLADKTPGSNDDNGNTSPSQQRRSESPQDGIVELVYRRGMYMSNEATLKDLRNKFIESCQAEEENRFFQFLCSDVPGDYIPIDAEEETKLTHLQSSNSLVQPQTLYMEQLEDGKDVLSCMGNIFSLSRIYAL